MQRNHSFLIRYSLILLVLLAISAYHPFDSTTWILEVFPIFIALPILWLSYPNMPLTPMLYIIILIHCVVLMVGGHYSYARVPWGFSIENWLHLSRNPYDKIGHFMQGFTPALLAREIFIRKNIVHGKKMLVFLPICVAMLISSCYELIEWAAAVMLGQGADEFLGTQGDPWDTQSDMLFALIGSSVAMLLFSKIQNKQIDRLNKDRLNN